MSELVFEFFRDYSQWFNYPALIVVMLLCFKNDNILTAVVFLEFITIAAIHDQMVATGTYGPNIVMYILLSGLKDIAIVFILHKLSANITLKIAYLFMGAYLILTWLLMNYYRDLAVYFYRFRGFFIVATMLLQVYGLTQNGGIKRNNPKISNKSAPLTNDGLPGFVWSNPDAGIDIARAFKHVDKRSRR